MDPAPALVQEVAMRAARHTQPQTIAGPIHILAFESGRRHPNEFSSPLQVRLGQIHKSLLSATFRTSGLALKPHPLRHRIIMICNKTLICDIFLLSVGEGMRMSRVRDLVHQRELFCVEEHQSVAEVARKMTDLHVGAILVFNGDQLRGIFSERDLMKRVVVESCDPERTAVGLVMSTQVVTIDEAASLEDAMESMQSNNCRHLPVTHNGRVVAFLSMRDLMNFELAQKTEEIHHMRAYISNA
jgi:CBS domain-containing protein